ncbi:MAG: hypothetical protein D6692_07260 [Planctomycetota bacterium]|nr:MAG: hypothetical protein D6692_07260 [Planctomycetota bacterium]
MDIRAASSQPPSMLASGGFAAPSFGAGLNAQRSFAEALGDIRNAVRFETKQDRKPEDRALDAARQLVATTLVEPILKQARETNHAPPPFGPTQAERQFGSLLDHKLAQDIVTASDFPLVDRLAQDLLRKGGPTA